MAKVIYDMTTYKTSSLFRGIHEDITHKKTAFESFLNDGEQNAIEKQEEIDQELREAYQKSVEDGQIFAQYEHIDGTEINLTLQEAYIIAGTVYLYAQFEFLLLQIARNTAELFEYETKIEDYNKHSVIIKNYRKYIKKVSKIDTDDLKDDWEEIDKYRRIRNSLAHYNGIINTFYEDLIPYFNEKGGIEYDEGFKQIKVSKEYLIEMSEICFDYLDKIMELVWDNKPKK